MDRETAWQILTEHVQERGLQRHMQAVEAAMRWYAGHLGHDPDLWGLAGLLHDFDWEIHPTREQHPRNGAPILRSRGCPEEVIQAIQAHFPEGTGVHPTTPMDYALRACDEVTGLIVAACLVRPAKDVRQLTVKSVQRNWKDSLFAAAIDRGEVRQVTEEFSQQCFDGKLELWQHVGNVLTAIQGVAAEMDLDGRLAVQ
ncbi:MAG TPA: HDIG domain-containing protein [Thermoanaerobaculia bacterium]|jgi:putative nucleotidyltransferase with HDIG domain